MIPNSLHTLDRLRLLLLAQTLRQTWVRTSVIWSDLIRSTTRLLTPGQSQRSVALSAKIQNLQLRHACRAAAKPPAYAASEHAAFAPHAWQSDTRASTAMPDPWTLAQPRQPPYGYGSDSNMSTWQQQLANLQQVPVPGQHPQLQHQVTRPFRFSLGSAK